MTMTKAQHQDSPLPGYVLAIRDMKANGWSVDLIVRLALGEEGASSGRDAETEVAILDAYTDILKTADIAPAKKGA